MANSILLTVQSVNNSNLATSVPTTFPVDSISEVRANANAAASITATPSSALGTSAWTLQVAKGIECPSKLYFAVTDLGSNSNTISIYRDSNLTSLVAKSDTAAADGAVATLVEKNESGISGFVTLAGSNTGNSYVTITKFSESKGLALAGASEFVFTDENGLKAKYTVAESVSAINTAIAGDEAVMSAEITLTAAQVKAMNATPIELIAAPGAGYVIKVISGIVSVDYGSAAYTTHDDVDLAYSKAPTVKCATADGVLAATADATHGLIPIAGALISNDSIVITDVNGNPATGDSPVTVRVSYQILAV